MAYIPVSYRRKVAERADLYCEYCHCWERMTGGPMHIEHIMPESLGGATTLNNLAYACVRCNLHKAARTHHRDPVSNRIVPLFNPRRQRWSRHFFWSQDGIRIIGRTRTGRATIMALNMNHPTSVMSRGLWVDLGMHPPD